MTHKGRTMALMWTKSMAKSDTQISRWDAQFLRKNALSQNFDRLFLLSTHCPESLWIVQGHVVLHYKKGGYFQPLRALSEAETFIAWHCSRRCSRIGACV